VETIARVSARVFVGLSLCFAIACEDDALADDIRRVFATLAAAGDDERAGGPSVRYRVDVDPAGRCTLGRDGETLLSGATRAELVDLLTWDVNQRVADTSAAHILFHAGAVELGGRGVLIPGVSGSGKSTLTAALVRRGSSYLTDELVAMTADGGRLLPFPKALALDERSLGVLGMEPGAGCRGAGSVHVVIDALRPGATGTACTPGALVFPRYRPGVSGAPVPMTRADALLELLTNTVNLGDHGGGGLRVLADLVERCPAYALDVADLDLACDAVRAAVGEAG